MTKNEDLPNLEMNEEVRFMSVRLRHEYHEMIVKPRARIIALVDFDLQVLAEIEDIHEDDAMSYIEALNQLLKAFRLEVICPRCQSGGVLRWANGRVQIKHAKSNTTHSFGGRFPSEVRVKPESDQLPLTPGQSPSHKTKPEQGTEDLVSRDSKGENRSFGETTLTDNDDLKEELKNIDLSQESDKKIS